MKQVVDSNSCLCVFAFVLGCFCWSKSWMVIYIPPWHVFVVTMLRLDDMVTFYMSYHLPPARWCLNPCGKHQLPSIWQPKGWGYIGSTLKNGSFTCFLYDSPLPRSSRAHHVKTWSTCACFVGILMVHWNLGPPGMCNPCKSTSSRPEFSHHQYCSHGNR